MTTRTGSGGRIGDRIQSRAQALWANAHANTIIWLAVLSRVKLCHAQERLEWKPTVLPTDEQHVHAVPWMYRHDSWLVSVPACSNNTHIKNKAC